MNMETTIEKLKKHASLRHRNGVKKRNIDEKINRGCGIRNISHC